MNCTRCGLELEQPTNAVPDAAYVRAHPPDACVRLLKQRLMRAESVIEDARCAIAKAKGDAGFVAQVSLEEWDKRELSIAKGMPPDSTLVVNHCYVQTG